MYITFIVCILFAIFAKTLNSFRACTRVGVSALHLLKYTNPSVFKNTKLYAAKKKIAAKPMNKEKKEKKDIDKSEKFKKKPEPASTPEPDDDEPGVLFYKEHDHSLDLHINVEARRLIAKHKAKELIKKAENNTVTKMSTLIKIMLAQWQPASNKINSTNELVSLLLDENKNLLPASVDALNSLEDSTYFKSAVAREISIMFHRRDRPNLYKEPANVTDIGLLCGGLIHLRASAGIVILKLQELCPANGNFTVKYCDDRYKPTRLLVGGKVTPILV